MHRANCSLPRGGGHLVTNCWLIRCTCSAVDDSFCVICNVNQTFRVIVLKSFPVIQYCYVTLKGSRFLKVYDPF